MARNDGQKTGPGSIADTVAHLAIWARRAPRGFARVEYHSEYARAEADRRLGEVLSREEVPYHHVELPVRVTPSQAGRYLREHLEAIESGTVSITGLATAVAEEDRRDLLAILSVRREVLAELGLCQIWWLTPDFIDALIRIAPDLDSWFMVRLKIEEESLPAVDGPGAGAPIPPVIPAERIDDALRRATSLVERFERAKEVGTSTAELIGLAAAAAGAIIGVRVPRLAKGLADQVMNGMTERFGRETTDHPSVRSLNILASLLVSQDRVEEASPLIDRAMAMAEQDSIADSSATARDFLNIAGLLVDIDRPDRAELLYRHALAIAERALGARHPNVARHLAGLAKALWKTRRIGEAEALCRRALAIDETTLGPDHPDVAIDLNNLAVLLRASGRLAEAEPLFRRALAIEERSLGPDHPSVATDLGNLGMLLQHAGRLSEAEPLLQRALEIDERLFEPNHPAVVRDKHHLASVLRAMGRPGEADALLR